MKDLPAPITPERWLSQMFGARIAIDGGIVRRKVDDIERLVGRRRFLHEIDRREFHVVENAGQFVVFCNQDPVVVLR